MIHVHARSNQQVEVWCWAGVVVVVEVVVAAGAAAATTTRYSPIHTWVIAWMTKTEQTQTHDLSSIHILNFY